MTVSSSCRARPRGLAALVILTVLSTLTIAAQAENVSLLARWHDGPSQAILPSPDGESVYHGRGSLLEIVPLSDAAGAAEALSLLPLPGPVRGLALDVGLLYVANGAAGLQIVAVDEPTQPSVVGSLGGLGNAWDVVVLDGVAFVAIRTGGVSVVDVSDPTAPVLLTHLVNQGSSNSLLLHGQHLFLAHNGGVRIFDVSDPTDPGYGTNLADAGQVREVAALGDVLLVPSYDGGEFFCYDISDPAFPVQISVIDAPILMEGIAAQDDLAIIIYQGISLLLLDLTDPAAPETILMAQLQPMQLLDLAWAEDRLHLAGDHAGYFLYDVSIPADPSLVSVRPTPGQTRHFVGDGRVAVAATEPGGLFVLDLGDSQSMQAAVQVPIIGCRHVALQGDLALASAGGWYLVDVGDPQDPQLVGSYVWEGPDGFTPSHRSVIRGDLAFLAYDSGGLQIIDIADPSAPTLLAHLPLAADIINIALEGDLACLTGATASDDFSVFVVDVTDPQTPALHSQIPVSWRPTAMAVADAYLYLTRASGDQLYIYDLTDPDQPQDAATLPLDLTNARGLAVDPPFLYVSGSPGRVQVYNLDQPAAPVLVGSYEADVPVGDLAVLDEAIYVATPDGGGLILLNDLQTVGIGGQDQQEPGATPLLVADALHCWPNPLNPGTTFGFSLPHADRVRLEVVDLRGRLVARLIDGELAAGRHAVDWDGRDLAGRRVASGNYLGRLVSERMVSAAKIMVVK